jgi:protein-disulfide isomerase
VGDAAQVYGDKVEADFASGVASGVRGTPALFLQRRMYAGPVEAAALRSAIRALPAAP